AVKPAVGAGSLTTTQPLWNSWSPPVGPPTVRRTPYEPVARYTCSGSRSAEVPPSPNSHHQDVMFPDDVSENCTTSGATPVTCGAVKLATGIGSSTRMRPVFVSVLVPV